MAKAYQVHRDLTVPDPNAPCFSGDGLLTQGQMTLGAE